MAVVGNLVGEIGDLRLECWRRRVTLLVFLQTLPHLESNVYAGERRTRIFEQLDDAQTLPVVLEPAVALHAFRQHLLARMPERRMTEIVRERNRFGEVFIKRKRA